MQYGAERSLLHACALVVVFDVDDNKIFASVSNTSD